MTEFEGGGFEQGEDTSGDFDYGESGRFEGGTDLAGGSDSKEWHKSREAVLFAVDCSEAMFDKKDTPVEVSEGPIKTLRNEKRTVFGDVLKTVCEFMKTRIIRGSRDKVGVMLYNIGAKCVLELGDGFNGIHVLKADGQAGELQVPDAERVAAIEKVGDWTLDKIHSEFKECDPKAKLGEVLWLASTLFSRTDIKKTHNCRLLVFTTEDDPVGRDKAAFDFAVQRAQDLQAEADLELFPMQPDGREPFNFDTFWSDVLQVGEEDHPDFTAALKLGDLKQRIWSREFKQRTLNSLTFEIAEGVQVAVCMFTELLPQRPPTAIKICTDDNTELKPKRVITDLSGASVLPESVETYFEYGGEQVKITKKEIAQIKKFDEPGMKLLGFKPKSSIKLDHIVENSKFIYPNKNRVKGSRVFFSALLTKMIERDVVAIVRLIPRANATPYFAALVPQRESKKRVKHIEPSGFHLIGLPWAEDIRHLQLGTHHVAVMDSQDATEADQADPHAIIKDHDEWREQVKNAKRMIRGMKIDDFHPQQIPNPMLQRHYQAIESGVG
ncbi:unnamed protein product [Vitrella brassicaformis CCMP3155]|uniref:Ku domain-containing protein n=1 Tax=Vitrella brassicaformis (strain CCMP3155) TaxID=1169540 RepID=A0A0G4E994_VITBC|nr:unnamed protein product [Vitrella brassicaformis CCMP3155]|eukprot:CEL91928.1 unnamed protein product [Vitrella brassicaformis CCMP3155]